MKRFIGLVVALTLGTLFGVSAYAATTTMTLIFNSPPSTSITCTNLGPFVIPVPAGTTMGTCTVAPSNWTGSLALSGPAESQFTAVPTSPTVWNINVGAAPISATATDVLTVTSTP